MAGISKTWNVASISASSHETALCVIPPWHVCRDIDKLRSLYDKAYGKWPPHINLVYPFVAPQNLPQAKEQIERCLQRAVSGQEAGQVSLDQTGYFEHRTTSTIFLRQSGNSSQDPLALLRSAALQALGQAVSHCNFHLTIGQSEDESAPSRKFLLDKARLFPVHSFPVHTLAILIRERASSQNPASSRMRLWGTIEIPASSPIAAPHLTEFWLEQSPGFMGSSEDESEDRGTANSTTVRQPRPGTTYGFDQGRGQWMPAKIPVQEEFPSSSITISSYNVLIDSEYPPARDRDPLLVEAILSSSAIADILVLQEVSDDFLSYLLGNDRVRRQYPFTSHAPPSQSDIGPLPSLRNIVLLSRWSFLWEYVPFQRRHKGAVVATFPAVVNHNATGGSQLVVAGVHLTCGLTDGSVAAKKVQLHNLIHFLNRNHSFSPWVVAGDFNITTSKCTIELALKNRSISQQTVRTLESMEYALSEVGLLDSWSVARVQAVDETVLNYEDHLFEGEEGSTFNPRENELAATTSGTSNNRPQRYDRILVRPQGLLRVKCFNQFGLPSAREGVNQVPSDHSGIRTSMTVQPDMPNSASDTTDILQQYPVELRRSDTRLSRASDLVDTISKHGVFPSTEEGKHRQSAFELLKAVILGSSHCENPEVSDIPMIIVPVGSYALGVWTTESDIDCLCIGSVSSKTFFRLARQRILGASSQGVRLLRKVEANTGTMLELSARGISMDLQYCPAAGIVQRWPDFQRLPPSDSLFNLPILSLRKLKPIRDLAYIQRTLPSIASFRVAYHCIKIWTMQRGIYSAKFGFLGGVHITLMLSWVCKRLAHQSAPISACDLVVSFFHHYANFDWENDIVFDAFFHKKKPRYHRTAKEPMVVLGFHAPNSNIAHTATIPGLQAITKELRLADAQLSLPDITWDAFLRPQGSLTVQDGLNPGAGEFLSSYDSYVKIDIQFWGRTLSKGKGLVGWVESRCINLVVDIHKSLPHLYVRIWPARFTDSESDVSDAYYQGCYLIGLLRNEDVNSGTTKEDRVQAKQIIHKAFDRFLSQVQANEKHYDRESCWVGIALSKRTEVKDLKLDSREWGNYVEDPDLDSDEEEELDDLPDSDDAQAPSKLQFRPAPSEPVSSSKLRPAADVLNRLRWDPNLDPSDYVVGYEDRFLGAKETTLERWKTEQTDDEFIPQHRILYFKKRGEGGGEVVWERSTRIDKIFGSGAGSGEGNSSCGS